MSRAVALLAMAALATVGIQLATTQIASAHSNAVTGVADCQTDGTYTVTWTIANDYQFGETVSAASHSPSASSVTIDTPHLDKYGSGTATQTGVSGTSTSASLTVTGVWDGDGFTTQNTGTVELDGTCRQPAPPTHIATSPTVTQASCTGQTPKAGYITIPSDPGVVYSLDNTVEPAGNYPVSPGPHTVTVSSTVFTLAPPTSFSFTVATPPASCDVTVSPPVPAITQASCAPSSGTPTDPSIVPVATTGITYEVSPAAPYRAGESVTVTATAGKGYVFGPAADGWVAVDTTHETYHVTFQTPTCTLVVVPQSPSITQSACGTDGAPTAPTLTLPSTAGITYTVDKPAPYTPGEVVVVTATTDATHSFSPPPPAGWTYVNWSVETLPVTFAPAPWCAHPSAPVFTDATCRGTTATPASYTIPQTTGVDYFVNGVKTAAGTYPAADGSTITVTVAAQPGYTLSGQTTFPPHTFPAAPTCQVTVVAAQPSFDPAQCVAGAATTPTYTIPSSVGVDYLIASTVVPAGTYPAVPGATVSITARAQPGYVLSGPTMFMNTYATTNPCGTPAPVKAVVFAADKCQLGVVSPATFTIPDVVGVDYFATVTSPSPSIRVDTADLAAVLGVAKAAPTRPGTYQVAPGSTVRVTARAQSGYVLVGTSSFTFTYPAKPVCGGSVVAAAVTFHNDVCASNGTPGNDATFTVPAVTGAAYFVNGARYPAGTYPAKDGATVTVIAKPTGAYALTGVTEWSHQFPATPDCGSTGSQNGGLGIASQSATASAPAYTGAPIGALLLLGVSLLAAGGGALVVARERRPRRTTL